MKIKKVAASECRAAMTKVMDSILQGGVRYIITKNNHPRVVVLSMKDYKKLKRLANGEDR